MAKVLETSIDKLIPDNKNFNKGTQFGEHLMDESLRKFGLGRSILLDKNNRIISGNKTTEKAGELGYEKVLVIETDGSTLVAVKRNDIDLDSKVGRELALADNATSKANLSWDEEMIMQCAEQFDFDPEEWGVSMSEPEEESQEESKKEIDTRLIVECGDVTKLSLLFRELQDRGFKCELKE
jgi:hypothetical protein|nr:MAG TPA: ParB protein [Caudoviricetes sp.]